MLGNTISFPCSCQSKVTFNWTSSFLLLISNPNASKFYFTLKSPGEALNSQYPTQTSHQLNLNVWGRSQESTTNISYTSPHLPRWAQCAVKFGGYRAINNELLLWGPFAHFLPLSLSQLCIPPINRAIGPSFPCMDKLFFLRSSLFALSSKAKWYAEILPKTKLLKGEYLSLKVFTVTFRKSKITQLRKVNTIDSQSSGKKNTPWLTPSNSLSILHFFCYCGNTCLLFIIQLLGF